MEFSTIVEIRIGHTDHVTDDQRQAFEAILKDAYEKVMLSLQKQGIWCKDIEKVVVTNNYREDVFAQAKEWDIPVTLSANKEYIGVAKALYNHDPENPKWQLFFPSILLPSNPDWLASVLTVYLSPFSQMILPQSLRQYLGRKLPAYGFKHFTSLTLSGLCPAIHTQQLRNLVLNTEIVTVEPQGLFNLFARKLKRGLYRYNANPDKDQLWLFWEDTYAAMYNLLLRSVDIFVRDGKIIFEDKVVTEIVNRILMEVAKITDSFTKGNEYTYDAFEKGLIDFLSYFRIEITDTHLEDSFYIHLDKNPKDYFKNLLVDTEPRIVCFMDILGFSQMIEDYEQNDLSTVLQDIQKAFKNAISVLNYQAGDAKSQEFLQYLEYKTFSDNICISLPYFDNETDFLANLNLMVTFVRGLQYALMTLGFFTRGGLTIGSYYSDQNMIFSKALVDAYHLESKKAVYPRVLIADNIIEKLVAYKPASVKFFSLESSIIRDKKLYCINPFMLMKDTSQMIVNLFNPDLYGVDSDSEPLIGILKTMTSHLGDMLQNQLIEAIPEDDMQLQTIIDYVNDRKVQFRNDRRAWAKYLWVEMLIAWKNGQIDSKRFSHFTMPDKEV